MNRVLECKDGFIVREGETSLNFLSTLTYSNSPFHGEPWTTSPQKILSTSHKYRYIVIILSNFLQKIIISSREATALTPSVCVLSRPTNEFFCEAAHIWSSKHFCVIVTAYHQGNKTRNELWSSFHIHFAPDSAQSPACKNQRIKQGITLRILKSVDLPSGLKFISIQ